MHWKTKYRISVCMVVAAVSSVLLCGLLPADRASADNTAEQQQPITQTAPVDNRYCLRNCNGWIGIYQGEELIRCTEIPVDSLRNSDRLLLDEGIHTDSWDDLLMLLEDFGS